MIAACIRHRIHHVIISKERRKKNVFYQSNSAGKYWPTLVDNNFHFLSVESSSGGCEARLSHITQEKKHKNKMNKNIICMKNGICLRCGLTLHQVNHYGMLSYAMLAKRKINSNGNGNNNESANRWNPTNKQQKMHKLPVMIPFEWLRENAPRRCQK